MVISISKYMICLTASITKHTLEKLIRIMDQVSTPFATSDYYIQILNFELRKNLINFS